MDFKHGGDITNFAKEIGCSIDEVIDLSSNINFIKPKIDIDIKNISSYPNYNILYKAIAKEYGVNIDELELFNGATSAIYSLFREFNLDICTLFAPIYLEYKRTALINGYKIEYINRLLNKKYNITPNSLVIFVNPSTPDGKFYNIDSLVKECRDKSCTLLIDESFLDFTNFKSALEYIKSYKRLYILKSMTKFYGSAGIRVGGVISNSNNIARLKEKEPIWKISEFDSRYIIESLKDRTFKKRVKESNNREKLIEVLKESRYIDKIYTSSVNFILVKLNIDAKEFQKLLTPYKIMVRDCSNFDFLDSSFIRIAIKDNLSIEKLKEAICKIYI